MYSLAIVLKISLFCLFLDEFAFGGTLPTPGIPFQCDYFNDTLCKKEGRGCEGLEPEECKPSEFEKKNMCYTLYKNSSEGLKVKLKGCWVGSHQECLEKNSCIETRRDPSNQLLFCCCEGSMCNKKIHTFPFSLPVPTSSGLSINDPISTKVIDTSGYLVLYIVLCLLSVAMLIIVFFVSYRWWKQRGVFNQVPTSEPERPPSPALIKLKPLRLLEVKAQGRFGAVWKAESPHQLVAVKIFPPQDKNSWQVEKDIFQLPQMKHTNVLLFLGAEAHAESDNYWLVTQYHALGSLTDFLKSHLVTWKELLTICSSIARGLAHLHEELPPDKPSIAHRDFKSRNVLIKEDMTACIADFGLAITFFRNQPSGDAHGQVGTRRYMAPEVLEGAITFSRDAFLRIDVYACALVLWEVVSRCAAQDGPVPEYALPFEDLVGPHPSLEDMQEAVAQKKLRPMIQETWKVHQGLSLLCETIEECWDQDAEARLSASCIAERISLAARLVPPSSQLMMSKSICLLHTKESSI